MQVSPASNNQVKLWKKLSMTKHRKKEWLFIAEGERCVEQILLNGFFKVDSIVIEEGFKPGAELKKSDVPVFSVGKNDFQMISGTETSQGILAVCNIPDEADVDNLSSKPGLLVAMDAVQDPGNVGTIIRTASWFESSGILAGEGSADLFHPKVVRSTAGATGSLPYLKGKLEDLFNDFEKKGWQIYLMDGSADAETLHQVTVNERSILVIGNEGSGISDGLFAPNRKTVRIPGNTKSVESLNAAIALGIGLYQFKK